MIKVTGLFVSIIFFPIFTMAMEQTIVNEKTAVEAVKDYLVRKSLPLSTFNPSTSQILCLREGLYRVDEGGKRYVVDNNFVTHAYNLEINSDGR